MDSQALIDIPPSYGQKIEDGTVNLPTPNKHMLGPESTMTTCHYCHAIVKTAVRYKVTSRTLIAAALCFMTCFCCCIPFCSASAKNSDHYCPNCSIYLGTYEK